MKRELAIIVGVALLYCVIKPLYQALTRHSVLEPMEPAKPAPFPYALIDNLLTRIGLFLWMLGASLYKRGHRDGVGYAVCAGLILAGIIFRVF